MQMSLRGAALALLLLAGVVSSERYRLRRSPGETLSKQESPSEAWPWPHGPVQKKHNLTVELVVRPLHLMFKGKKPEAHLDSRTDAAEDHGAKATPPPATTSVEKQRKELDEAWIAYTKKNNAQPMETICAEAITTLHNEWAFNKCSMEFHEHLQLCEEATPYCKYFKKGYETSLADIEYQGDKFCTQTECEPAVDALTELEDKLMKVAAEEPNELYPAAKQIVPSYRKAWTTIEAGKKYCLTEVCTTLQTQAASVAKVKKSFEDIGTYESTVYSLELEQVMLYDVWTLAECKDLSR